jgi:hypothetical protein
MDYIVIVQLKKPSISAQKFDTGNNTHLFGDHEITNISPDTYSAPSF